MAQTVSDEPRPAWPVRQQSRLTCGFTYEAGDGNRTALSAWEAIPSGPVMPPDLRGGVSASDPERLLATDIHAEARAVAELAWSIASATHVDYDVVMSKRAATPVRFDPPVADRLASFVAANPGMSLSSAANRLVDEALRMAEHPGVIFRSGPTGRRAALAGGPDVWEVIRAIKSAHAAEPGMNSDDLVNLVSDNAGIALRLVNTAVRYWATYPSEVDAEIAAAPAAEEAAEQAWLRERQLLAG